MSDLYRTRKPGDILRLHVPLGDIEPGNYVLLSLSDPCCLAVLGENMDGDLVATNHQVYVSLAGLSLFVETGLRVQPL